MANRSAPSANRAPARLRCAIYTRKSSEEGLEQDFNSLDAQREACEAFIASQKREGWSLIGEMYDDGGFSGATMERPAFQRLLSDVSAGQDRRGGRLQGRPADPVAVRLRQDRRHFRQAFRLLCVGHPAVQHHVVDGAPDAQYPAVVCPVRARGHRRAHPRQDRGLQEEGHVDGRPALARLRRQRPEAHRQRRRKPRRSDTSSGATPNSSRSGN